MWLPPPIDIVELAPIGIVVLAPIDIVELAPIDNVWLTVATSATFLAENALAAHNRDVTAVGGEVGKEGWQ